MGKQLRRTRKTLRQRGGKSMDSIMEEIDNKIHRIQDSPLKNKERYIDVLSSSKDLLQDIKASFQSTTKVAKAHAELSFLYQFHKNHEPLYNLLIRPVDNLTNFTSVVDALPTDEPVHNVVLPAEEPTHNVTSSTKEPTKKKEKQTYTVVIDGKEYITKNRDLYYLLIGQGKKPTILPKSRKSRKHRK